MKKVIMLLSLLLLLASCSVEAIPDEYKHQGEWELVRTQGNFAESERMGEDLEFRETYVFKRNGNVTKTQIRGNSEERISGTYKIVIPADTEGPEGHLLFLTVAFKSKNPLVANCMDNSVEDLVLTDDHVLLNTWYACDGLLMEYNKVN